MKNAIFKSMWRTPQLLLATKEMTPWMVLHLATRQQYCHRQCLHAIHNPLQQFKLWTWKVVSKVLLSIYKSTLYIWVLLVKVNLLGTMCHSCVLIPSLIPSHVPCLDQNYFYIWSWQVHYASDMKWHIKFKKWYINQEDARN